MLPGISGTSALQMICHFCDSSIWLVAGCNSFRLDCIRPQQPDSKLGTPDPVQLMHLPSLLSESSWCIRLMSLHQHLIMTPSDFTAEACMICIPLPKPSSILHHPLTKPLCCTGWAAVGLTWAYAIMAWLVADLAKVVTQKIFRTQAKIKEICKQEERTPPAWVRIVDVPGSWAEKAADVIETGIDVSRPFPCA